MLRLLAACAVLLGCSGPGNRDAPARRPADVIVTGAAVVTINPRQPRAEALAIRGGEIVYVGERAGALELRGARTTTVHLPGAMVLPGFHDTHVHPVTGGIEYGQCNLNGASSTDEVAARIRKYASTHEGEAWIVGGGWDLNLYPNSNPGAKRLDELVPDRPAFLTAADAHSAWVNSRALAIAGITADTKDPPGGRIERDEAGEPTGTLRESAMALVSKHIPPLEPDDYDEGLRRGLRMANGFGITSVQEASADDKVLAAYHRLDELGQLSARVVAAQRVDLGRGIEQVDELARRRNRYATARLRPTSAKIFADGVIEAKTAALLEPYLGSESRGHLNLEPKALDAMVRALDGAGFDVHIHAIGDRAIRESLDAFEVAIASNPKRTRRHVMAHLQLIDPADHERFEELGVVASFQPLWAQADPYIRELTVPFLGPERSRWLYPIKTISETGAHLAFGSDWSVSSMNPLRGIQVALTRRPVASPEGEPFIGAERVDLDTALAAYTRAGAHLNRQLDQVGTLEVGKRADLVILERDLYRVPASKIHAVKVLATLLDGEVVFCRPALCQQLATAR